MVITEKNDEWASVFRLPTDQKDLAGVMRYMNNDIRF